jgi:hypothetical protein
VLWRWCAILRIEPASAVIRFCSRRRESDSALGTSLGPHVVRGGERPARLRASCTPTDEPHTRGDLRKRVPLLTGGQVVQTDMVACRRGFARRPSQLPNDDSFDDNRDDNGTSNYAPYSPKMHLSCLVTAPARSWQCGDRSEVVAMVAPAGMPNRQFSDHCACSPAFRPTAAAVRWEAMRGKLWRYRPPRPLSWTNDGHAAWSARYAVRAAARHDGARRSTLAPGCPATVRLALCPAAPANQEAGRGPCCGHRGLDPILDVGGPCRIRPRHVCADVCAGSGHHRRQPRTMQRQSRH